MRPRGAFGEWGSGAPFTHTRRSNTSAGSLKKSEIVSSPFTGIKFSLCVIYRSATEGMKRFFICVHPLFAALRLVMSGGGGDAKSVPGRAKRIAAAVHGLSPLSEAKYFYFLCTNCVKGRAGEF